MCFTEKKVPALIVGIGSGIVLIMGIVMIILAIMFNSGATDASSVLNYVKDTENLEKYRTRAFKFVLIGAIIALASGILGLLMVCCHKKIWYRILNGCVVSIAAILLFIYGIVIWAVSATDEEDIRNWCAGVDADNNVGAAVREWAEKVDSVWVDVVSNTFCSAECPCYANTNELLDQLVAEGKVFTNTNAIANQTDIWADSRSNTVVYYGRT